jgi:hypothetical protein
VPELLWVGGVDGEGAVEVSEAGEEGVGSCCGVFAVTGRRWGSGGPF